jgi:chemotaxis protein MotB
MGARRAGRSRGEDNSWIETYADAITLLMAFFVVLLSMSDIDQAKYERVAAAISAQISHHAPPVVTVAPPSEGTDEGGGEDGGVAAQDRLATQLEPISQHENVTVQTTSKSILVEFSGKLLYDMGSAVLRKEALPIIDEVTVRLTEIDLDVFEIIVEGHTDDAPIGLAIWPSNWELSAARATSVVRRMLENGVSRSVVAVAAFADTRPLAPNRDEAGEPIEENRARNRRIVIRINRK